MTSSEALATLIGGGRRGHGGRSAAEGRPSGPPSSAACSRRTRAPIGATLAEAQRQALSWVREAATLSLQIFSDACRTLLPSLVPTHGHPTRCPRAGVALASTTSGAFRAAQVEHGRTLIDECYGKVSLCGFGRQHRRCPGAGEPSPLGGWACPAACGAVVRAGNVARGALGA